MPEQRGLMENGGGLISENSLCPCLQPTCQAFSLAQWAAPSRRLAGRSRSRCGQLRLPAYGQVLLLRQSPTNIDIYKCADRASLRLRRNIDCPSVSSALTRFVIAGQPNGNPECLPMLPALVWRLTGSGRLWPWERCASRTGASNEPMIVASSRHFPRSSCRLARGEIHRQRPDRYRPDQSSQTIRERNVPAKQETRGCAHYPQ